MTPASNVLIGECVQWAGKQVVVGVHQAGSGWQTECIERKSVATRQIGTVVD